MKCLFSSMIQKLHFWQEDCLNLISTFYASYQNLTKSVLKRFSRYFRSFKRGHLGSHPYLGLVRVAKVKYFKLERHSSEVFSCFFFCQIWRFAAVFWWKWTKTEIFPREGMYVMAKKNGNSELLNSKNCIKVTWLKITTKVWTAFWTFLWRTL